MEERSASGVRMLVYDVSTEESEVGFETAGPLFERCTIGLTGLIDRRWVECYRKLTSDGSSFSGFRLEPAVARVSFVSRRSAGPAAVMSMMTKLQELLALTNKTATAMASTTRVRAAGTDEGSNREPTATLAAAAARTRSR